MSRADISGKTAVYGVIGWPVEHSLSPLMHNSEFERIGLDCVYVAWPIDPAVLETAVRGFAAAGVRGFNATIPHKQALVSLLDEVSAEAVPAGAVNTVKFENGKSIGYNTDIQGWLDDIQQDILLQDSTLCIIGGGGAARALALACGAGGATSVLLCNRTPQNAEAIGADAQKYYPNTRFAVKALDDRTAREAFRACDIVVNATPVGMDSRPGIPVPAIWLRPEQYVYDTIYTPAQTELLRAAHELGCAHRNGMGMLARQGAVAFEIWTGVKPDAARMEATLRNALA